MGHEANPRLLYISDCAPDHVVLNASDLLAGSVPLGVMRTPQRFCLLVKRFRIPTGSQGEAPAQSVAPACDADCGRILAFPGASRLIS